MGEKSQKNITLQKFTEKERIPMANEIFMLPGVVMQVPGSNALDCTARIANKKKQPTHDFPPGDSSRSYPDVQEGGTGPVITNQITEFYVQPRSEVC